MHRIDVSKSHFIIPHCPDFLEPDFILGLTDESKDLFELGGRGQGYIGLVDLVTGEIHLVPSFNKNDGLLRLDKNGIPFKRYAESIQTLGTMTGDLHTKCASILKLGDKGGINGKLMGFGVWKAGCCVKFLSSLPSDPALIPNEYLLIKENNKWELFYVNVDREVISLTIAFFPPELSTLLLALSNKSPEGLTQSERKPIEEFLQSNEEHRLKLIKNRSSSQNFFSIKYDEVYTEFFRVRTKSHQAHSLNQKRELPLPVFEKIIRAICANLNLPPLYGLPHSPIVPGGPDGLRGHFDIELEWMDNKEECIEHLFTKLAENDDAGMHTIFDFMKANHLNRPKHANHFKQLAAVVKSKPDKAYQIWMSFLEVYDVLDATNIFDIDENFAFLLEILSVGDSDIFIFSETLRLLGEYGILTPDNFKQMAELLTFDHQRKIYNESLLVLEKLNEIKKIKGNNNNDQIVEFFSALKLIPNDSIFMDLNQAIFNFKHYKILQDDNHFEQIVRLITTNPTLALEIFEMLMVFKSSNLFSEQNFPEFLLSISKHVGSFEALEMIADTFDKLLQGLNLDFMKLVTSAKDLNVIAATIIKLNNVSMLSKENFELMVKFLVANPDYSDQICLVLKTLQDYRLLDENTFPFFISKITKTLGYADQIIRVLAFAPPQTMAFDKPVGAEPKVVWSFVKSLMKHNDESHHSVAANPAAFFKFKDSSLKEVKQYYDERRNGYLV